MSRPGTPEDAGPRRPRAWGPAGPWALRDVVVLAVLAVVFGFLYWALVHAWGALQVAMGPLGDLAQNALMGGWITVAPLAVFIVRRPGSGIVAEIAAAFVEFAFLGSPAGPTLLIAGLVQGGGAELAFALTRYRRFGWPTFLWSGVGGVTGNFLWAATMFDWWNQDLLLLRAGLQLLSGLLLTGVLAKLLADGLLRTGVLDPFAAGQDELAVLDDDEDEGDDEGDDDVDDHVDEERGDRPAGHTDDDQDGRPAVNAPHESRDGGSAGRGGPARTSSP